MKFLTQPFHCFNFSVLSAGLAWAFFPWRNNLAGIMAGRPGQNTDLTNGGKAKWLCIQHSQEIKLCSHTLLGLVGHAQGWAMCTPHGHNWLFWVFCRVWLQTRSCPCVQFSCAARNAWLRLGLKRWPSFIPTTGMNSALKVKRETTCRSAF